MGFFSELGVLAKDIGGVLKDSAKEIKGIAKEGVDEFAADPKKFTVDSIKEVGAFAGSVAVTAGKIALEQAKEAGERTKQYQGEMPNRSDDELLKIVKDELSTSPLKTSAALNELENRGHDKKDVLKKFAKTS